MRPAAARRPRSPQLQAAATSRCVAVGGARRRAPTRQPPALTGFGRPGRRAGSGTSASLPARWTSPPSPDRPPSHRSTRRLGRRAPASRRSSDPRSYPAPPRVRPAVPARGGPDRRRDRHRPAALDGPRQRPPVHRRAPARLPPRPAGPLAGRVAACAGAFAIIVVYVIAVLLFVEFLDLTLTPLINEIVRFIAGLPRARRAAAATRLRTG